MAADPEAGAMGPAEDVREEFRRAVEWRDAGRLRALLDRAPAARALVNEPIFAFDAPALVHVAGRGDVAMIDALLDHGADPNARSQWWAGGFHALYFASGDVATRLLAGGAVPDACAAARLDRLDLLRDMLDADPARVHERGGDGQTPLHFARSRAVVDLLLECGADPDARDVDHRSTPAQWMLERRRGAGRYDLAAYLVERGATPDIFLAAALGLTDRLRRMVEDDASLLERRTSQAEYGEQPPSSFQIYTWTIGENLSPLQVAAQFEQAEAVELLRALASPRDLFLAACAAGEAAEARRLLAERPDLLDGLGPAELRLLPDAGEAGNADAVALMLELGFDPAATAGPRGGTVLHLAAWTGHAACVAAVLRHPGTRPLLDARDAVHGGTPLDWCRHGAVHCRNPEGDYDTIERLLVDAAGA